MNLVIDIGSTALKACTTEGITLGKSYRYQGERYMDFLVSLLSKTSPEVVVISSVKDISDRNREILSGKCSKLVVIPQGFPSSDRQASAIAASYLFKGKGVTVFDFGSTLSIDFISPEGIMEEGFISPGCRTRIKAVNRYSKNLPLVEMPQDKLPDNTGAESSIQNGIIRGMEFEIAGYISRKADNIIVFTGGDANYFAKRMKNSIFVVCNLVLMGLAIIADRYEKGDI